MPAGSGGVIYSAQHFYEKHEWNSWVPQNTDFTKAGASPRRGDARIDEEKREAAELRNGIFGAMGMGESRQK